MSRLQLAVDDGEHTDAAAAALGWRQEARLAGRLHHRRARSPTSSSAADERADDSLTYWPSYARWLTDVLAAAGLEVGSTNAVLGATGGLTGGRLVNQVPRVRAEPPVRAHRAGRPDDA
jgi:hypothetical protein